MNKKIHYRSHNWPPPIPILSQLHPVHTHTSHLRKIYFNPLIYAWVSQVVSFFRFPHQSPVYDSPLPHTRYMRRPSHYSRFDHPNKICEEYRSLSSPLCTFLHSPLTSSLLGPNILLNTLFSKTLGLRSSLNASDQVSHPYKTTGKIIVLYILIFKFSDRKLEDKRFYTEQ